MTEKSMNNVPFVPSAGNLLIKPSEREQSERVTESGIVLPGSEEKPISSGRVASVSDTASYEVGDLVVYSPYSGYSMEVRGTAYKLLAEHEVLGRITEDVDVAVR